MARDQKSTVRVAATGDLHCREDQHGRFRNFVKHVNEVADVLLLCGDLTDRGTPEEGRTLAEDLSALRIPCVAVFGNHDYEAGAIKAVCAELTKANVHVLDGDHYVYQKTLGVAGDPGFGADSKGHPAGLRRVAGQGVRPGGGTSRSLEAALGQLETPKKVVMLHYSPIVDTCVGELPEIMPFLGTSRLSYPIDHYGAAVVFHGHSHFGSREGKTPGGIRVLNVAMPLLAKTTPEQRFALVEV